MLRMVIAEINEQHPARPADLGIELPAGSARTSHPGSKPAGTCRRLDPTASTGLGRGGPGQPGGAGVDRVRRSRWPTGSDRDLGRSLQLPHAGRYGASHPQCRYGAVPSTPATAAQRPGDQPGVGRRRASRRRSAVGPATVRAIAAPSSRTGHWSSCRSVRCNRCPGRYCPAVPGPDDRGLPVGHRLVRGESAAACRRFGPAGMPVPGCPVRRPRSRRSPRSIRRRCGCRPPERVRRRS